MNLNQLVYQFKIELLGISPPIWRRIQIPAKSSFWDLHVAIQDAMGWLDYHLHLFQIRQKSKRKMLEIGIPDEESEEVILPGWEIKISDYFTEPGIAASYDYDFGDGWTHNVLFEGILLKETGGKYPKCLAGDRACPPEDCGGVPGYERLIEILKNRKHHEYQETIDWVKIHAVNYFPYMPDHFEPSKVHFWDPKKRWELAFSSRQTEEC